MITVAGEGDKEEFASDSRGIDVAVVSLQEQSKVAKSSTKESVTVKVIRFMIFLLFSVNVSVIEFSGEQRAE